MPSDRPKFEFENPFRVDVDFSKFRSKKKSGDKVDKAEKAQKAEKDDVKKDAKKAKEEPQAAAHDDNGDDDDDNDEKKPITAHSSAKDADIISLKTPPTWLVMPTLVMAAFIINGVTILVATIVSVLVLGGKITIDAAAIGLTQSLVLFSAVFGLVYISFHCFAARKALGVGLFRRRHRRPLHTTIVQIGRITVALWCVAMLAVGITMAKEPASAKAAMSVLRAELACSIINVVDMLLVMFVVERTRMPFVLPWLSPPVPEGDALTQHAKALIEDILGDGVAGQTHPSTEPAPDTSGAAEKPPDASDTPVTPPAKAEAAVAAAAAPAAVAVPAAPAAPETKAAPAAPAPPAAPAAADPGTAPAAFMAPPPPIYPYAPYHPFASGYHPFSAFPNGPSPFATTPGAELGVPPGFMPGFTPGFAPGFNMPGYTPGFPFGLTHSPAPGQPEAAPIIPDPSLPPAHPLAPGPHFAAMPTPTHTPRMATIGKNSAQPTPSAVSNANTGPPPTPGRPHVAPPSKTPLSPSNNAPPKRSDVWSRADEGSYTTAPPASAPYNAREPNDGGRGGGEGRGQRPPLSSYVSPMLTPPQQASMYGPRPGPARTAYPDRHGQTRPGRGRGGNEGGGRYEPVRGHAEGPRGMPPSTRPRVEGKKLFNKAAEGLKAKEKDTGRSQEGMFREDWGSYNIPGSWW